MKNNSLIKLTLGIIKLVASLIAVATASNSDLGVVLGTLHFVFALIASLIVLLYARRVSTS
ncbi:hypothetical protein LSI01_04250 [Furfurilactobacillus siliginis]|uniref:Uncharacterized protein n=1 Tax=Furfurilactobacillus siliginis TaxID=348151 RepID=A0A510VME9_9LACO|nr:hypothetical protein LSI01_04250 [Furfurilactobacillus siliginis]